MHEEQSLEKQLEQAKAEIAMVREGAKAYSEHSKAEIVRLREEVVVVDTVWKQAEAELRSVRKQRDVAHDTFEPSVERQPLIPIQGAHFPVAWETYVLLKMAVEAQLRATASVTTERDQLKAENDKLRAMLQEIVSVFTTGTYDYGARVVALSRAETELAKGKQP